jgi:hypothetical protein
VAHLTTVGASIVTLPEFARGKPVRAEQGAELSMLHQIEWRARFTLGRTLPYDLLNRNCEHYANYVMGKKPEPSSGRRSAPGRSWHFVTGGNELDVALAAQSNEAHVAATIGH